MEMVTLPKEVAEAISALREIGWSNVRIASALEHGKASDGSNVGMLRKFAYVDGDNEDLILAALVNGYKVEKTPEEQIRELYEEAEEQIREIYEEKNDNYHNENSYDKWRKGYYEGVLNTVKNILDILGIEVEGINA